MNPEFSPNYQAIEAAEDLFLSIKLAADGSEKESLEYTCTSTMSETLC